MSNQPMPAADPMVADDADNFSLDDDTPLECPVDRQDGEPCEACQ